MENKAIIQKIVLFFLLVLLLIPMFAWHSTYIPYINELRYISIITTIFVCPLLGGVSGKIKMKNLLFFCTIIVLVVLMLYSAKINTAFFNVSGYNSIIQLFLLLYCFYSLYKTARRSNNYDYCIFVLYLLTLVLVFVNDLVSLKSFMQFSINGIYPIGTKFDVIYLHYQMIILGILNLCANDRYKRRKKSFIIIEFLLTLYMSIKMACVTGTIGIFILLLMLFLTKYFAELLCNPKTFVLVLITSCSFIFIYNSVLKINIVRHVLEDILKKNLTMTGRTHIYGSFFSVMSEHWMFGYGYQNSYEASTRLFTYNNHVYANSQNGIAEWILRIGVIGTVVLLLLIYLSFKNASGNYMNNSIKSIVSVLYVYAILASVEITLEMPFFFWIVMIVVSSDKESMRKFIPINKHKKIVFYLNANYLRHKKHIGENTSGNV